jgi:hypothetical protein
LDPRGREWLEAREDCTVRSFITCVFHQILLGDQAKEDDTGGEYSTYGGDEKCIQNFLSGNTKGRKHLEELGIDGKILLEWICEQEKDASG